MNAFVKNRDPVTLIRNEKETAILLETDEYEAMKETLHLLSTPTNAERIHQGLADYANEKLQLGKLY
ncbi:MAG: hypothetical protein A3F67_06195 [Verrucomicrobia bacterium RIFCSPHIGHO2_12_FULL_41_10]|nr:MAG: hypothetical protein A3F67_06195 [Verrucomicrobia bacterium RIFCSPHIGHO2_12_FULL_41_10]HLB33162.1 type II toxin-antitoxin system Phd/YefM family antitoxin [Chthoniobacterales bacterium]